MENGIFAAFSNELQQIKQAGLLISVGKKSGGSLRGATRFKPGEMRGLKAKTDVLGQKVPMPPKSIRAFAD